MSDCSCGSVASLPLSPADSLALLSVQTKRLNLRGGSPLTWGWHGEVAVQRFRNHLNTKACRYSVVARCSGVASEDRAAELGARGSVRMGMTADSEVDSGSLVDRCCGRSCRLATEDTHSQSDSASAIEACCSGHGHARWTWPRSWDHNRWMLAARGLTDPVDVEGASDRWLGMEMYSEPGNESRRCKSRIGVGFAASRFARESASANDDYSG